MEVFLTKRAQANLVKIRDKIRKDWGTKASKAFENRVLDFFVVLAAFPKIGSLEEEEKEIFGFQLSSQTRVFYRLSKHRIIILNFFEVRQHPDKKLK